MTIRTATLSVALIFTVCGCSSSSPTSPSTPTATSPSLFRFLRHNGEAPGSSRCRGGEPHECRPGNSLRRWRLVYRRRAGHAHCACRRHLSKRGDGRHACVADMPRSTRGLAQGGLRRAWSPGAGPQSNRSIFLSTLRHPSNPDRGCPSWAFACRTSPRRAADSRGQQASRSISIRPVRCDHGCRQAASRPRGNGQHCEKAI